MTMSELIALVARMDRICGNRDGISRKVSIITCQMAVKPSNKAIWVTK